MKKGRKKKIRFIQKMPNISQFSPRGKPGRPDEVELTVDEFEAIKLSDYQGYDQSEGAEIMGISRPTFGRILRAGREALADCLVNGKSLYIRTGDVQVGVRQRNIPGKAEIESDSAQSEEDFRKKILGFGSKDTQNPAK